MAKQTFTTGQVLTAAQMTSLQQTAMLGGDTTAKTTSYVLVAADAGTTVAMNAAGATTITVNTGLFAAGDIVFIQNRGAGTCTITAGTATVVTAGSLALPQNDAGILYFTSTSAAVFYDFVQSAAAGGKLLQVVTASTTTATTVASTSYTDTTLTATITPTSATSTILVMVSQFGYQTRDSDSINASTQIVRGATSIYNAEFASRLTASGASAVMLGVYTNLVYRDSPATTSATTYKTQGKVSSTANSGQIVYQDNSAPSTITLLEIGA